MRSQKRSWVLVLIKNNMSWSFAFINGRLAEIFFEPKGKRQAIFGHCYVDRREYKTKMEQKMIDADIKRLRFTYRNKKYVQKKMNRE